jgi:hypothetical protein
VIRTWQLEMLVVGVVLLAVALATGGGFVELLGAGAVLLSFGHGQVSDRLAEREAARERPSVACHRMAARYCVGKESLWLLHHSWTALAGVGLFLAYTPWRRFWRARKPLAAA